MAGFARSGPGIAELSEPLVDFRDVEGARAVHVYALEEQISLGNLSRREALVLEHGLGHVRVADDAQLPARQPEPMMARDIREDSTMSKQGRPQFM